MSAPCRRHARGSLLLYHFVPPDAGTITDHVSAFKRYSRFPVWAVNVAGGYPPALGRIEPSVVILHYSLFGIGRYPIPSRVYEFLDRTRAYKVAFFQDEYQYGPQRIAFLNEHAIDCVYTLVEPAYHDVVYGAATTVRRVMTVLPGYVNERMIEQGAKWAKPDPERRIDVGYRARRLPAHWGQGAREKAEIGERFKVLAAGSGLVLDIQVDNAARIYGSNWYRFLGDCRAVLGVESGVSVFDLDDSVRLETEAVLRDHPDADFDELSGRVFARHEGNVPYRTVSPRHFEAAATRSMQVLFEGAYSGVLEPVTHYIPLRKDFGNLEAVLAAFRDRPARLATVERAYEDLIASGRYTYGRFVADFDDVLADSVDDLAAGRRHAIGIALSATQAPGMATFFVRLRARRLARRAWCRLPATTRAALRPGVRRVLFATVWRGRRA